MKTIHPTGLLSLIAAHQPFDLIDVRTRKEFDKAHIPGARSIPLQELRAARIMRERKLPATEPLYVICRSRVLAGLASGILEGAGCSNAVVVDGGMETWRAEGLPVVRKKWFPGITTNVPMMILLAGFGVGLGLAIHAIFFVVPLIIVFTALGSKIYPLIQRQKRRAYLLDLADTGPHESWVVPHLSRLAAHLGGRESCFHPRHRIRFVHGH